MLGGVDPTFDEMARQTTDVAASLGVTLSSGPSPDSGEPSWWSVQDAMTISAAILCFGVLFFALVSWLTHVRVRRTLQADELLRLLVTPLIVLLAVFLVVAGYSDKQIAPVMGLLGTIAGYLLGKAHDAHGTTKADPADGKESDDANQK